MAPFHPSDYKMARSFAADDLSALYLFAFNKAPPYIPKIATLTVKTAKKRDNETKLFKKKKKKYVKK